MNRRCGAQSLLIPITRNTVPPSRSSRPTPLPVPNSSTLVSRSITSTGARECSSCAVQKRPCSSGTPNIDGIGPSASTAERRLLRWPSRLDSVRSVVTNAAWRTPGYAAAIAWTSASFQSDAGEALSSDALPPLLRSEEHTSELQYRCWLTPGNGSADRSEEQPSE